MPELPDLEYIAEYLQGTVAHRTIISAEIHKPVILRLAVAGSLQDAVAGKRIEGVKIHGPFLTMRMTDKFDLVVNLMVAGKIQHQRPGERPQGHRCLSLSLDDKTILNVCDPELMAKVYLVPSGEYGVIPKYQSQGTAITGKEFTLDRFLELASLHSRKQVRVFINDHTIMSSIGNAYADEILFEAGIHPKTFVARLSGEDRSRLYEAIHSVMEWGKTEVKKARKPIHEKVRDHMRVRNRRGEPCPRCGTKIRREGVRGHDVFFCPQCQPASRRLFVDWSKVGRPKE